MKPNLNLIETILPLSDKKPVIIKEDPDREDISEDENDDGEWSGSKEDSEEDDEL